MPEKDSDPESLRLGRLVTDTLGIASAIEDIAPILAAAGCYRRRDEFIRTLVPAFGPGWGCKLVIANALAHEGYNITQLMVQSPDGAQQKLRMPLDVYLGIVARAADLSEDQVERVWCDIAAKRKATRYLHEPPLLVEAV